MSNSRQIESKEMWSPNGLQTATILSLTNFHDYHFDNGSGYVTYKLIGMQDNGYQTINNEDGTITTNKLPDSAIELHTADLEIPSNIIQNWGDDDQIIFEYAATKLSLILI